MLTQSLNPTRGVAILSGPEYELEIWWEIGSSVLWLWLHFTPTKRGKKMSFSALGFVIVIIHLFENLITFIICHQFCSHWSKLTVFCTPSIFFFNACKKHMYHLVINLGILIVWTVGLFPELNWFISCYLRKKQSLVSCFQNCHCNWVIHNIPVIWKPISIACI